MKPNYNYSHLVMLLTCQVILKNLLPVIQLFSERRLTITLQYIEDLNKRILEALSTVSQDKFFDQRNATANTEIITDRASKNLKALNTDLKDCFRKNKPRLETLLQILGFNQWFTPASKGIQTALTSQLLIIKENITPLCQELIAAGISEQLINNLVADAIPLNEANAIQESIKDARPKLTEAQQIELNDIYDEVMTVCNLGKSIYEKDAIMKKQFTFGTVAEDFKNKKGGNNNDVSPDTTSEK